jgi:hypothetical protein
MTHIAPDLARRLDDAPDAKHDVIVLTNGSVDALLATLPSQAEVRHVYRLRKGIALRASGDVILSIDKVAGVTSVEPDRSVSAQS